MTRSRLRAQIVPLFALSAIGFVALVGLVIDGGTLYLQRRTAQNAADAAALAGARALQQSPTVLSSTIASEICKYAVANAFGVRPSPTAHFVGTNGTTNLGAITLPASCSGTASNLIPTGTSGIHVDLVIGPYITYLAGIVGVRQLTAQATATAQVGGLAIPNADLTPLAGCGPDMLFDGKNATPSANLLLGDGVTIPYSINPATPPMGDDLVLQGSQLAQNSGANCPASGGSSWKGKIDTSGVTGPLTLPASVPTDTGNGNIDSLIVAGCTNTGQADPSSLSSVPPDVCLLLVPIAAPPNPAGEANIVTFACFSMYAPGPGYQKWRGVLHPVADCPYGVYVPGWIFGASIGETRVLLTS